MNDELNIYLQLTRDFNAGRPRALLAGGQAVVLYRLALPWMRAGWSAHFEFPFEGLRVRTDFVTRPARLPAAAVSVLWAGQGRQPPAPDEAKLAAEQMILTKQTNREKDYAAIGELARLLEDPLAVLRYSRSARDILEIAARHPDLLAPAETDRPCLAAVAQGRAGRRAAPSHGPQ